MVAELSARPAPRPAACVLRSNRHPREFFAPDKARRGSLRCAKSELLAGCGVDRVHICRFNYGLAQTTAEDFIERIIARGLRARWVLVGDDFRFGARRAGDLVMLKQAGPRLNFEVAAIASVMLDGERVSSTALRQALAAGDLDRAGRLLGRAYSISGRVVAGDGLGRKLGFPTANVQMKRNHPPFTGIFVVRLHGAAREPLRGVASLGVRPTVKPLGAPGLGSVRDRFRRRPLPAPRPGEFAQLRDEEKYAILQRYEPIALDVKTQRVL